MTEVDAAATVGVEVEAVVEVETEVAATVEAEPEQFELEHSESEAGSEQSEPELEPKQSEPEQSEPEPVLDQAADSADPGRRRWIGRGILVTIIVAESVLTLHNHNTAYQDEGLYLLSGHLELDHLLHGVPETAGFNGYFSGVPALYPVLAALADSVGGLAGARLVSLVAMACTVALLYATTRYLFDERVACAAAALFAVSEPTIFLGNFANFDALTQCLLALAVWIVVRTSRRRGPRYLLAAPVLALAVAVKYFALLFVPTVALLAGIIACVRLGRRALWRAPLLGAAAAAILVGGLSLGGTRFLHQALFNATSRVKGSLPPSKILSLAADWSGWLVALAVLGVVLYALRESTDRRRSLTTAGTGRWYRWTLGAVLACTALLAPLSQIRLGNSEGLFRHVGYGMLFAAPMAGIGLTRIVGDHFRWLQLGIAVWITVLLFGAQQARAITFSWPNSNGLTTALAAYQRPGGRTYVDIDTAEIYYLKGWDQLDHWASGYSFYYDTRAHGRMTGYAAYRQAVQDGYFDVIAYNRYPSAAVATADNAVATAVKSNPAYRLVAVIPLDNRLGVYYIWLKRR